MKKLSMTKDAIRKRAAKAKKAQAAIAPPVAPVPPVQQPAPAPANEKPKVIAGLDTHRDLLCTTGEAWNARHGEIFAEIKTGDNSFPFHRFEYVATQFPNSRFSVLRCSDTQHEIGVPFDARSYFVFNNAKLEKWIDVLQAGVEKLGCKLIIKTAGTLRDRGQQFVSFQIDGLDKLEAGGREIRSFLSMLKGLDKQMSFTLVNSTITVCCKNTFKMVKDDTNAPLYAKVKFTRNAELRIDEVPRIVDAFISGNNALLAKLKHWHAIGVNATQAEQIFSAWLGNPQETMSARLANIIARLKELHAHGKGNKGETALDAFNAVTEYYTHECAGETENAMKQVESSEIGTGAEQKAAFFDYLTKAFDTQATFDGICKCGETILIAYNKARKGD